MKALILIAALFAAPAFASVGPALVDEMSNEQAVAVEKKINEALLKKNGTKDLRNLRVQWNSAKCLEVASEMDPNAVFGVCTLPVTAFQLEASIAMIKTATGYDVRVIYFNVE